MAQFLKLTQFTKGNRVAQVDVDTGRVDPIFDTKGLACFDRLLEFLAESVLRDQSLHATAEDIPLLLK